LIPVMLKRDVSTLLNITSNNYNLKINVTPTLAILPTET